MLVGEIQGVVVIELFFFVVLVDDFGYDVLNLS